MINYQTYKQLGFSKLEESEFASESATACLLIENITQGYYSDGGKHSIDDDLKSEIPFIKQRALLYEKAVCLQCEFQNEYGSTPMEQAQNQSINSVSIGKTSVNYGKAPTFSITRGNSGVNIMAYKLLYRTGLLFCGVDAE